MAFFCQILLWGSVLGFGPFVNGENICTANPWLSKSSACKYQTIRGNLGRSEARISGNNHPKLDVNQEQCILIRKLVTGIQANGMNGTFEKINYLLRSCKKENLDMDEGKGTVMLSFWDYKISDINIVLFFVNLLFFMFLLKWGFMMVALMHSETVVGGGERERHEMSDREQI